MPNDAKLGLLAGVAVVITIAVLFFQKQAIPGQPSTSVGQSPNSVRNVPPPSATIATPPGNGFSQPAGHHMDSQPVSRPSGDLPSR